MKEYTKNLGKVVMTPKGAWSIEKEYEILDIVYDSVTDHAYISKQEVPLGVDLSDSRYWMPLNVSGYSDSNVITLNNFNEDGEIQSYTLEEAIKVIKDVGRKSGAILIFYNNNVNRLDITTGCWEIWQFNSINVYDWENLDSWVNVYYNYNKFVGWYAADNTLNKEIPSPDVGCYAFVGNVYNEAFVYRCDVKNRWTKTNQKAQHYIKVIFGDNISIGINGNWWQDGVDTNIPVSVKGDNGLTPYLRWNNDVIEYSYNNVDWFVCSEHLMSYFRWYNNKIQTKKLNSDWKDLSPEFKTNIKIDTYVSSIDLLPNYAQIGSIYGVGPTYTEDDINRTNPIYRIYVYTFNGWIDNGIFKGFSAGVVQKLGDSETEVISQKAVTEKFLELGSDEYKSFFVGNNDNVVKNDIYGLIKNNKYQITLKDISWDISNVTSTAGNLFGIYNVYNEEEFWIDSTPVSNGSARKIYEFIVPENSDYIRIVGRANKDVVVKFNLKDITKIDTLVKATNVTSIYGVNIDTVNKVLDFGSDVILAVGNKSYILQNFHSDPTKYRSIPYYESDSGAHVILFNLDNKEIYAKTYDYTREENEVLIGSVSSVYQTHEFKSANFPFTYKVDGEYIWKDDINNIQKQIIDDAKEVYENYFIGDNNNYVSNNIYGLISNHTYRITLKDTSWDVSGVNMAGTPNAFMIQYYKDGQEYYVNHALVGNIANKQYNVTMPSEFEYLIIGGRATKGVKVRYKIEDITDINDFNSTIKWNPIVKGINHRGWHAAPENTLVAYKQSSKKGFRYVECDVSFTKDNVPVLLHDDTIDRTSNGTGAITELTYDELLTFDFGSWKANEYVGEKIPTFESFVILCRNLGLHPYIEIKYNNSSKANVENVVNIVNSCGMRGQVTYISFSSQILVWIKEIDEKARLGFVVDYLTEDTISVVNELKTDNNEVFVDAALISDNESNIGLCIEEFIPLEVWTVNSSESIVNAPAYISGFTSDSLLAENVLRDANLR